MQLGPAKESWEDEEQGEEEAVWLAAAEPLSLRWRHQSSAVVMALAPVVRDYELLAMAL